MSLFRRMRDISMSQLNHLLDKAEDPIKMLDQYLKDMEEDIGDAERSVAKQIALEKRLNQQLSDATEMVEKRQEQALQGLEQGKEDLARRALEDKQRHQSKADDLQGQWQTAKVNADKLKEQLLQMKDEYETLKGKKQTLQARAEAAKAQKSIHQAFSGMGSGNARKGFDKMEDKVLELESEAEASGEMRSGSTSLDDELDSLGDSDVDRELAELKAKLKGDKK